MPDEHGFRLVLALPPMLELPGGSTTQLASALCAHYALPWLDLGAGHRGKPRARVAADDSSATSWFVHAAALTASHVRKLAAAPHKPTHVLLLEEGEGDEDAGTSADDIAALLMPSAGDRSRLPLRTTTATLARLFPTTFCRLKLPDGGFPSIAQAFAACRRTLWEQPDLLPAAHTTVAETAVEEEKAVVEGVEAEQSVEDPERADAGGEKEEREAGEEHAAAAASGDGDSHGSSAAGDVKLDGDSCDTQLLSPAAFLRDSLEHIASVSERYFAMQLSEMDLQQCIRLEMKRVASVLGVHAHGGESKTAAVPSRSYFRRHARLLTRREEEAEEAAAEAAALAATEEAVDAAATRRGDAEEDFRPHPLRAEGSGTAAAASSSSSAARSLWSSLFVSMTSPAPSLEQQVSEADSKLRAEASRLSKENSALRREVERMRERLGNLESVLRDAGLGGSAVRGSDVRQLMTAAQSLWDELRSFAFDALVRSPDTRGWQPLRVLQLSNAQLARLSRELSRARGRLDMQLPAVRVREEHSSFASRYFLAAWQRGARAALLAGQPAAPSAAAAGGAAAATAGGAAAAAAGSAASSGSSSSSLLSAGVEVAGQPCDTGMGSFVLQLLSDVLRLQRQVNAYQEGLLLKTLERLEEAESEWREAAVSVSS
eukprot:PLAT10133.1.p1 GENE.PLAT10133.1~~PLAT10133.1.p1  ORF type:complete len:678 (-),score=287.64 PLAT10133.1:109-2085(-)